VNWAPVASESCINIDGERGDKPARNFEYMLEKLDGIGVKKEKILHTAESVFHDHKPANDFGLKSCWVCRRHAQQGFGATMNPGQLPRVDIKFNSMHELVKTYQEQLRVK
jgi:2-haloacid dehalogenase